MSKKISLFLVILMSISLKSISQTILQPNFGLKSHETLSIKTIETDNQKTLIYMSIENRITGGRFCADKNIYIIYPDGQRSKLRSSLGIPVCPDAYEFKAIGEKLDFTLTFSPLKPGTKWIDLIEDCNDNCFSFYGITLDSTLNRKIDEAYLSSSKAKPKDAINGFKRILDTTDKENLGSEGILYMNIITLSKEAGDDADTRQWYGKFLSSGCPRLSQYIKYLNDQGIKY